MLNEFKEFAVKGNVVDLAIGIILGVAFTAMILRSKDGTAIKAPKLMREHKSMTVRWCALRFQDG